MTSIDINLPEINNGKVTTAGEHILDLGERMNTVATETGMAELFTEMRAIALKFLHRCDECETKMNYIIATVYVNLIKRKEDGDDWAPHMIEWLDAEIKKLNNIRASYLK